jgi:threonylcarbamoyladenosine tRNA methylthiotransferase MtaB
MIPDVSISTDIMVGFPGETDDEFEESIAFVDEMAFSRLHIFRFSPRPGTSAATMPSQVAGPASLERSRRMHELGADLERDFNRRFIGCSRPVLWEQSEPYGGGKRWTGLTDNYIRTVTETPAGVELTNHVTDTRLLATAPGGMLGEVAGISNPIPIEPDQGRAGLSS